MPPLIAALGLLAQGIITVDDLNEGQVEALAGGESLRHETITLSSTARNRKALQRGTRRLLDALQRVRSCTCSPLDTPPFWLNPPFSSVMRGDMD